MTSKIPYLWREDGQRFSINDDGTYSSDATKINMPTCYYRYTFEFLMNTGQFSSTPKNMDTPQTGTGTLQMPL